MDFETRIKSASIGEMVHRDPSERVDCQSCVNLPPSKKEVVEDDIDNETLHQQLERLWKTDFGDSAVGTKVSPSVEDKMALSKMEQSLQRVG